QQQLQQQREEDDRRRRGESRRSRAASQQRGQSQAAGTRPETPEPVEGRKHMEIQTVSYLEDLVASSIVIRGKEELLLLCITRWIHEGGIMLDTKLFKYKANGKIWETDLVAGDAAYDDEAKLYNVNLGASYKSSYGKFRFGLSYTKCDTELSTFTSFGTPMLGYAYLDHAENMASRREAWTISGNDFNNEGEQAWQIAVEYRLPSSLGKNITPFPLDDITFMFIYREGFFDALNPLPLLSGGIPIMTDIKERQAEYRAYYRFDEEKYSGVSIGMAFIDYRINEDFVALVSAQPNNVMTGREFRLYIDYAF
ncbi:MAG: hypothetical protein QM498_08505, partial [Desulfobacterium sp.]